MKNYLTLPFVKPIFFVALLLSFNGAGFAQTVPTNPIITVNTFFTTVNLTWSADNADGYRLYYAPYPDPTTISNIDMGTQTSLSIDLPDVSAYFVAIKAYNGAGESDFSNIEHFDPFQSADMDPDADENETFTQSQDLFMVHHKMSKPVMFGSFVEQSTAQSLAGFSSSRLCGTQTGVLEHVGPLDENHWVYIKNGVDVYYLSEHANRPSYKMYYCDGTGFEKGLFGPVTKAKDVTVITGADDQAVWIDDGTIANPYLDCNLTFSGYIWLRITCDIGDFDHFSKNVMQPLQSATAWDSTKVVMDQYIAAGSGYYADVSVHTDLCAQKTVDQILGQPAIQITGRRVDVTYTQSSTQSPTCGAYVAPGALKEFDCYNLAAIGKTTNDDPFTPSWSLIGGYWQWGRQGPDPSDWFDTNTEHFAHGPTGPEFSENNNGSISGWVWDEDASSGALSDEYKTANDPCPPGFRVPSMSQWEGVIANNTLTAVGTWDNDDTNYSSGRFFGNDLMLPAAGARNYISGTLFNRGGYGSYWSSSEYDSIYESWYLDFGNSYARTHSNPRRYGFSVRCVAE